MIDLELLRELTVFKKYGTLSATAKHLMITQPSVTRGMKKLEDELGVQLFNRTVNRISLTATGELAANEAQRLLDTEQDFRNRVTNFDKMQRYINVGSVAPGALLLTQAKQKDFQQALTFVDHLIPADRAEDTLREYRARLIFTDFESQADDVESMYIGQEKLFVKIDKFNPLSQKKSLSFDDLKGLTFLVVRSIGPWRRITAESIPGARFLYQEDVQALDELTKNSTFPVFRSNLTEAAVHDDRQDDRVLVPIVDHRNKLEVYGTYLKSQRPIVQPFVKDLIKIWPN
jgi:DNA-binding transcriptional LysR family regulator